MSPVNKAVVGALLAAAAGSANAISINNWAADNAAGKVANVYIGGSTAVGITLIEGAIHSAVTGSTQICASNIDVYDDKADKANPGKQLFIFCTASSALGLPSSVTEVAIFKEFEAGSQNGSVPLIAVAKGGANTLQFYNAGAGGLTDAGCAAGVAGTLQGALAYTFHGSCAHTVNTPNIVPVGVSDLEASFWASATDVSTYLQSTVGLDPVWAVPVNKSMYDLLQKAQFGVSGGPYTAANQPTLSKAQIASMYNEAIFDMAQMSGSGATAGTTIGICRREAQSGTQKSAEIFFMHENCGDAADLTLPSGDDVNIFEMNSTGNMLSCLSALDTGATVPTADGTNPASGGPNRPAIGVVSSENGAGFFDGVHGFAVKVDGASPTLENVVNGFYPYFAEDYFYNAISSALVSGNCPAGKYCAASPSGKVWESLKVNIGHPGFLADVNKNYVNYWGQSGDLAYSPTYLTASLPTIPATQSSVQSNPINAFTHNNSGTVNNCNPAILNSSGKTAPYQNKD